MKILIHATLLFLYLTTFSGYAQIPQFLQNLSADNGNVCYGANVTYSTAVANATHYAFQLQNPENGSWSKVSEGTITTASNNLEYTIYGLSASPTVRVLIVNGSDSVYSNQHSVNVQRPLFSFHPSDLVQCNGEDAIFRVSSPNGSVFQWQGSTDGGASFTDLLVTAKFKNATTPDLTVTGIVNDHNGQVFRCKVMDAFGCEEFSDPGILRVNRVSSAISPTLSTQFCEGDTARFFSQEIIGDTVSTQWQLRRAGESSYSNLSENAKFAGVNSSALTVKGILPAENSYRVRIGFKNALQNSSGQVNSSVCYLQSVRANYVINSRPEKPSVLDTVSKCGPSYFNFLGPQPYNWYADTLSSPLATNSVTFQTQKIAETAPYYFSWKDTKGCESHKQQIVAQVHSVPSQSFGEFEAICPTTDSLSVNFSSVLGNPQTIYIRSSDLSGFGSVAVPIAQAKVLLPGNKNSGVYNVELFTKNEHCFSDTVNRVLTVLKSTLITNHPSDAGVCLGEALTLNADYQADLPVSFVWQKDNVVLTNQNEIPLRITSVINEDAGNYRLIINGACGSDTSALAMVAVSPAIEILQQPANTSVCTGNNTVFKVNATGSSNLHYQWFIDGVTVGNNADSLVLENVSAALNNAKIKCRIESNCSQPTFTNEVTLLVNSLPLVPVISDTVRFCTSLETAELVLDIQAGYTANWYNELQQKLDNSIINLNQVEGKTYFVSQTDANGCESSLTPFVIDSAPSFSISIIANTTKLCHSGNFNTSGSLVAYPSQSSTVETIFGLQLNGNPIASNTSGNFDFTSPGHYVVTVARGFCTSTDSLRVSSVAEDLVSLPVTQDLEVCSGESITLTVDSDYENGNYFWWLDHQDNSGLFMGKDFVVGNIARDTTFFVSYGRETDGVFCESPRAELKVALKGELSVSIETISGNNCTESNSVQISAAGQSPFSYTLNDSLTNTFGAFFSLVAGMHFLNVTDAAGCSKDTTFIIQNASGPQIISSPSDVRVCLGNIVNFPFTAGNYDSIVWLKKLPNEEAFTVIAGENTLNLRVTNSGNALNPHQTKYKAVISKGECQVSTSEATLLVNSISGSNPSKTVCENDSTSLNLESYNITGNVLSYQWQYRAGTTGSFENIQDQNSSTVLLQNVASQNAGYYRNRVVFDNENGNTCVINTSTGGMRLIVNPLPSPTVIGGDTICNGQSATLTVQNCNGIATWSDGKVGVQNIVLPPETTSYWATCNQSGCVNNSDIVTIVVRSGSISKPIITADKTVFCYGDSIFIQAENCEGTIQWSNGETGVNLNLIADNSFSISAICLTEECQSPSSDTLQITVSPQLLPGSITENAGIYCAGYNPPNITSSGNQNTSNIQWQVSQDCAVWQNIEGATSAAYNPPVIQSSTCYRRMVWNSCDTLYSNTVTIEIVPDPTITIDSDKETVCDDELVTLTSELIGGAGNCTVQWQINKVSAAVSNPNWRDLSTGESLNYSLSNSISDSTFHFRSRVTCDGNSCNIATSNVQSILFKAAPILTSNLTDTTVCAGSILTFTANCKNGDLLWSDGSTNSQISIQPTETRNLSVSCGSSCVTLKDSVTITVISEIGKSIITADKAAFCYGESVLIQAGNCEGTIQWSNGETGVNLNLIAESSFSISAICVTEECQSPSSDTLQITVFPQLLPGSITENAGIYCAGYNPPNITSAGNPNTSNIQWQVSQDCAVWQNIEGATSAAYNPPVIQSTTCYRRMVWNSCDTLYSNIVTIEIVPDPVITIESDKETVCADEPVTLTSELIGGTGNCIMQWQINKVSVAVSNPNWRDLSTGESLNYSLSNSISDSTFHFRSRVTCDGNSCNIATSNVQSILFKAAPILTSNLTDTTVCAGSTLTFMANCKNGDLLWSDGSTNPQISIQSTETRNLSVTCGSSCFALKDSVAITVFSGIEKPIITADKAEFCYGDSVVIQAGNCEGIVQWSSGETGNSLEFLAETNTQFSAICITEECQSPASDTLQITVSPQLLAGSITENTGIYCAGYNPPNITSASNPNTTNIQWQISQYCSVWQNIEGATSTAYNPPVIQSTTCYRRMVWNNCDTLYSNIVTIEIVPDPTITIEYDKETVCAEEPITLTSELIGGTGNCTVQWQINKVSAAVSNPNWRDLSTGETLSYSLANTIGDSTFHFRSRVTCDGNSCNIATSNVQSILFKAAPILISNLTDTTVCAGSTLTFTANCKNGDLLWSDGSTNPQISIQPTETSNLSVFCGSSCVTLKDSVTITVIPGIGKPIITADKIDFCYGDSVVIQAANCEGTVQWSSGETGNSLEFLAETNTQFSAICITEECQSPASDTLQITVSPQLLPGSIAENTGIYCTGYNPPNITSASNPNTTNIQWQVSQDCALWQNIEGATSTAYNPPVIQSTTCYRRMVWNNCDTLYSNTVTIEIVPDPVITIESDKETVCADEPVTLTSELIGGTGNCTVQWQINKVSVAVSNPNWRDLSTGESLNYSLSNSISDSTFHFRSRVTCDGNSCNIATSSVQSILFKAAPILTSNLSDTTVCAGSTLTFTANCNNGDLLWSDGSTGSLLVLKPLFDSEISVRCSNDCSESVKLININVTEGISPPTSITTDSIFSPASLVFKAEGLNLKWYRSESASVPLDSSPVVHLPGNYTFWVSQTIGNCESPRLRVSASLFENIGIISQTNEMVNCYGNVSNLTVSASGSGTLQYKWQRKLPDESEFSDVVASSFLSRENTASLRVGSTGNAESPTGTLFRCVVSDYFGQFTSAEIPITANRIQGSLPNRNLCIGETLALNLANSHTITGTPLSIQWQHRRGTGDTWIALADTGNVSGSNTLQLRISNLTELDQIQFRCSITFSSNAGSCIETSDLMTLKVGQFPVVPENIEQEICQGERLQSFVITPPAGHKVTWYRFNDETPLRTQPTVNTAISGNHLIQYVIESNLGCKSPKALIKVTVNPPPSLPVNTTPAVYDESESLTFSAVGENLKWYRTKTLKPYEDYPPTFNSTGRKSYYVTQTDEKGCESERLQIQSQMLAVFGISTQPVSRSNCDGNTVTFGVRTRGGTNISYQWQVDHQGVFIDLPGEIARDLRIADTGVSPFVDGSVFRCIVSSGDKKIISNPVELKVNYLRAVLPEINLCEGEKLSFERYADSLSGIINKIEWQRRISSSYSTVYESSNLSDFFVPDSNSSGSYRFRVTFHNLGGGSCVRNSNVIRFSQHTLPAMVGLDSLTFCEGESIQSLVAKLSLLSNLLHLDSTKVDLNGSIHQNSTFIVNTSNSFGCSSPYKTFKPTALPIPKLGNIDSVKAICRFSDFTDHKIQNLNTRWYLSENTNVYTENRLLLETHEAGTRDVYYKVKGENGCESEKYKMRVEVSSCYFEGDADTCLTTEYNSMERNEWTYFYKENGEIYGAIHPSGSNMGGVEMHVTSTIDSVFEDLSKNHFYPRSWTVNTSRSLTSPYKVRLYLSEVEIAQFKKTVRDSVTVLRKNSVTPNCDWEKDSTLMWMIGHGAWLDTDNDKYYFVEFETDKTGQFLLWSDLIPRGNLNVVLNQNQIPELSIENHKVLPVGNYVVNKSEKGIEWNILKRGIADQESFTDMRPYLYKTQYQLLYDFQNGIIALLDTKEINISETFSQCILFENPSTDSKRIAVYFPEVDKNKILLSDMLGREVPLKQVIQSSDRFEINPLNPLTKGIYILKMTNRQDSSCVKKVIVY